MHRATLELRERQLRVQKLAAKYEVMVGKRNNKGDDDEEGEHSQAYFVIKAAQEREQLQRQGDELDAKIRKAEKEVGRAPELGLVRALTSPVAWLVGTSVVVAGVRRSSIVHG